MKRWIAVGAVILSVVAWWAATRFQPVVPEVPRMDSGAKDFPGLPQRKALLVGVGTYPALDRSKQLQGPPNDVRALRDLLTSKWGFDSEQVQTLVDQGATRTAILEALDGLVASARKGDVIFLYLSGHGTSGRDPSNQFAREDLADTGAFLPYDVKVSDKQTLLDSLVIGRRDLRPRLEKLDTLGAQVFVVADACYSGRMVRSAPVGLTIRQAGEVVDLERIPRPRMQMPSRSTEASVVPDELVESPYSNVVLLSAVGSGDPALDVGRDHLGHYPTLSGKPHGAFTDALLRVMSGDAPYNLNRDNTLSFSELVQGVSARLVAAKVPYEPRTLPGARAHSYRMVERPMLASSEIPQKAPPEALRPPSGGGADKKLSVTLGASVPTDVASLIKKRLDGRVSFLDTGGELLISDGTDESYVCNGQGDAEVVLPFDVSSNPDAVVQAIEARAAYAAIRSRARSMSTFSFHLELADPSRAALRECSPSQQQTLKDAPNAFLRAQCVIDIGARLEKSAKVLAVNFSPDGKFFRIFPTRRELRSGALAVGPGTIGNLLETYAEATTLRGPEYVIGLAFAPNADVDLSVFDKPVDAGRGLSTLTGLLDRAGKGFGMSELRIDIIPHGKDQPPGLGACRSDL
jgi:hypothetical protein